MKKRIDMLGRFDANKKGQVTIFIILGIIIVALGIIFYMFYPQIRATFGFEVQSPYGFMQGCLEDDIANAATAVALHGGSIAPVFNYSYLNEEMEYLCYTNEYYKTCTVQQPFLINHIEEEIENEIKGKVNECFNELEDSFRDRGYDVILRQSDFKVDLLPKRIALNTNTTLSLKKEDTATYESFNIGFTNSLYDLASIAQNIIEWEATYGDSETTAYMDYYHDLKIEKLKQTDGTTVYMISDKNTGDKFQFASRSVAWPPGYWNEKFE